MALPVRPDRVDPGEEDAMAGGRPPKGPRIVDRLEASEEAKERLKTILQTITGETSVLQAREKLGVSDTRFYQLRDEVLKAALARMEPMARGRPRKETPERAAELARLREENEALKRELEKERVRAVLAEALPHVVKAPEEKKKTKPAPEAQSEARRARRRRRKEERRRRKRGQGSR